MGITRPPGSLAKQVSKAEAESGGIIVALSSLSCAPSPSLAYKSQDPYCLADGVINRERETCSLS